MADKYITHLKRLYEDHYTAFRMLEQACPELEHVNVTRIALEARDVLEVSRHLLSGENVWPYYDRVIRAGACDSIVESIGWLTSLMFIMGLIFFPLCAIVTHRFLVRWADWAASNEASELRRQSQYSSADELSRVKSAPGPPDRPWSSPTQR